MASKKVHVDEKEPHYKVANKVTGNALAINAMNATKRFLPKSKVNTRRQLIFLFKRLQFMAKGGRQIRRFCSAERMEKTVKLC